MAARLANHLVPVGALGRARLAVLQHIRTGAYGPVGRRLHDTCAGCALGHPQSPIDAARNPVGLIASVTLERAHPAMLELVRAVAGGSMERISVDMA